MPSSKNRLNRPGLGVALATAGLLAAGCGQMDAAEIGANESAIQGGQLENGFPAVGQVASNNGNCSGTLISPSYVLTAAHCAGNSMSFRTGTAPINFVSHPVDQQVAHPNKDLLLAHLSAPIFGVLPMPLRNARPGVGETCTAVGFGAHDETSGTTTTTTFDRKRSCSETIESSDATTIAVVMVDGIADHGDSGGPLLCGGSIAAVVHNHTDGVWPAHIRENYATLDRPWIIAHSDVVPSPEQTILVDVMSIPGWTSITPMNLDDDGLTDLLAYNAKTGRAMYSVNTGGGGQRAIVDLMASPGWTSLVPMDLNSDGLTDLLSYNMKTGRAVYSVNTGAGGQSTLVDVMSIPGWTSIIPMNLNNDGLTDLLAYNAKTGRAMYSVNLGGGGQRAIVDLMASPGWTSLVPMDLNSDGLTDLLSYNATTGRAVYSVNAGGGGQSVIIDVASTPSLSLIVPARYNNDALTDLLTYNVTTGRAQSSVQVGGGGQAVFKETAASAGWTALVPMNLNNDGLTDLLSYNGATGRAVYSVAAPGI